MKQLTNKINSQSSDTISLLTLALNIHLNIDQIMIINTSEIFMLLETISMKSLSNKSFELIENTRINIPSDFNSSLKNNSIISFQVC
jgi:3-methyladenine DNA glycosylase Mpg